MRVGDREAYRLEKMLGQAQDQGSQQQLQHVQFIEEASERAEKKSKGASDHR